MSKDKMHWIAILILIVAMISLSILVRVQNLSIASLTESVATLSSVVHEMVVQNRGAIAPPGRNAVRLANPASQNCVDKGGTLEMSANPAGQYGVCVYPDGKKCEEWALFRGECPDGGIEVSPDWDEAEAYCALRGGELVGGSVAGASRLCGYRGLACGVQEFFRDSGCAQAADQP